MLRVLCYREIISRDHFEIVTSRLTRLCQILFLARVSNLQYQVKRVNFY